MTIFRKLAAAAALAGATLFAGGVSAQTYNLNFGPSLTGQITTTASTGSNQAVTSLTGTFNGQAITGLIADPYSPAAAYYDTYTGVTTSAAPTSGDSYYTFDNLLLSGNTLDTSGIFFQTSSTLANLYRDAAGFELISSPVGQNASSFAGGPVTGSITPAAAVPESATWAMMILGVGAVGYAMRRKVRASEIKFDAKIRAMTAGAEA